MLCNNGTMDRSQMITYEDGVFYLQTASSSYWFKVTPYGHLEHIYWGPKLPIQDPSALQSKRTIGFGGTVAYEDEDQTYSLDALPLEWSGYGVGDFRISPLEIDTPQGPTTDFTYTDHEIHDGPPESDLPLPHGECETLNVKLADGPFEIILSYTLFPDSDVICRQTTFSNRIGERVLLRALASTTIDFQDQDLQMLTLDGAWIKESHATSSPMRPGRTQISSRTGSSSNQHNPGVILHRANTTQATGDAYGFNLMYSGNHQSTAEVSPHGFTRFVQGINPEGFAWSVGPRGTFYSPVSVMAFSDQGFTGLSQIMHQFVRHHIQPEHYLNLVRPVVFNGWEGLYFDFDEKRQLHLANTAAKLGMELFVVDDGWFKGRNSDQAGLGDYDVDYEKFPNGLESFGQKIQKMGMKFGLWFEPEMVSPDSDLYREHPEWAIQVPGRPPRLGRHQLVLDLANPKVQNYLVEKVGGVLDSAPIEYVKWDMNRHITDLYSPHVFHQGMAGHAYILGLYRVLDRIFGPRKHVMLEMCSSGGNRFDLGMLSYAAQIWASDDTDPIERLKIQEGLSYFYPLSCISAHVSNSPHQQTLRATPLPTRFNVAAFGSLGYEYDLDLLDAHEKKEIQAQISWYKTYRDFIHGADFSRLDSPRSSLKQWQVSDGRMAISGNFQLHVDAAPVPDRLAILGLEPDSFFAVTSKPQHLDLDRFGALIHHVAPVRLDPRGPIMRHVSKYYALDDADEVYVGTGSLLAKGVSLQSQFLGSGFKDGIRLLGDFGSTLYVTQEVQWDEEI